MAEGGPRGRHPLGEHHLLSGLGLQVVVVALLVFVYTQAARQLNYQRGLFLRLKEQAAAAKAQVAARAGGPDPSGIRAEVDRLEARLVPKDILPAWAKGLESSAGRSFGLHGVSATVGGVERTVAVGDGTEKGTLEIGMVALELQGTAAGRDIALFLDAMASAGTGVLCPLQSMRLEAQGPGSADPVGFHLKWLVATSISGGGALESIPLPQRRPAALDWGRRAEPFLSPFVSPRAVENLPELQQRFRLSGILWDAETPTCVVNGTVLKPGDLIDGYRVTLITPTAVLLQGAEEELPIHLQ